jgi:diguanylate cyclase (GGDEF)-like protein/PAS domain S-box-containing protein
MSYTDLALPENYCQALLRISQRVFAKTGDAFFNSLALALTDELHADHISIGRLTETGQIHTLAFTADGMLQENFSYPLAYTPCDTALIESRCIITENLAVQYPLDLLIVDMGLESYVGVRLFSSRGEILGLLNALYKRPLSEEEAAFVEYNLTIQALRIASELERMGSEHALSESRFQAWETFNHSPLPLLVLSAEGEITHCNKAFSTLSGYFIEQITGLKSGDLFGDNRENRDAIKVDLFIAQLLRGQATHLRMESGFRTVFGTTLQLLLDCYVLKDSAGVLQKIVVQMENITEQKLRNHDLRKLSRSVELSPVATLIADRDAIIEYVNPRFTELTGYAAQECVGKKTRINASGETPQQVYEEMWATILSGDRWQGELLNRRKDGRTYWARTIIFPILDDDSRLVNLVSLQEDISSAKALGRQLEYEASHDALTGLINRREFSRRLEHAIELARMDHSCHVLCFLDLDQFKIVNDTSGHMAGDELLQQVGRILQQHIRSGDTAARVGGDEFGLILSNCKASKAREIAGEIRDAIGEINFVWDGRIHRISASIGLTLIDDSASGSEELMKQVDTACYAAKDGGRNCIHLYDEGNDSVFRRRSETNWVPEVHTALQEQRFELFAQRIIALGGTPALPGYEILIRLVNREGQLVLPGEFLQATERYGLSALMDRCVFDRLYHWLETNPVALAQASFYAVNLSGASINNMELLEHLITVITHGNVPPHKLYFEITETAAISNIREARTFMHRLRMIGCKLVLDDFGRGLSSFAYLKNLPVDLLKIDGLFVREILHDNTDYTMVKMINELAHSLGIRTVAEYIEDENILSCIRSMGIDHAQGFAIHRPANLRELTL